MSWGGIADGRVGLVGAVKRELLSVVTVGNRAAHITRIKSLVAEGIRAAADSNLRLIFLHLPEPHFPPVWDTEHARFTLFEFRTSGYFGNLNLADHTLAQVMSAVHDAGLDEKTAFIITSDHPWRLGPIDGRMPGQQIPFIVALPERRGIEWAPRLDAIDLRMLVHAMLSGAITGSPQLTNWLAAR
jgi:hypothetical protein